MAATFPCLRPFVAVYEHPAETTRQKSYYQQGSRSNFKLTSVNSAASQRKPKSRNRSPDPAAPTRSWSGPPAFRPDQSAATHTATVAFYDKKNRRVGSSNSIHSHDSQKMIIERKVDYTVTYDDRSLREDGYGAEGSSADGNV
jgi:hypothetical protein